MKFNASKCQVLTVTNKCFPVETDYFLHGQALKNVKSAKYLDLTITKDIKWHTNIHNITSKANKALGFVKRNVRARHKNQGIPDTCGANPRILHNLPPLITQASTVYASVSKPSSIALLPSSEITDNGHVIFYPCTNALCCTLSAATNMHNHCLFVLFLSDRMAMILIAFLVMLYRYNQYGRMYVDGGLDGSALFPSAIIASIVNFFIIAWLW